MASQNRSPIESLEAPGYEFVTSFTSTLATIGTTEIGLYFKGS